MAVGAARSHESSLGRTGRSLAPAFRAVVTALFPLYGADEASHSVAEFAAGIGKPLDGRDMVAARLVENLGAAASCPPSVGELGRLAMELSRLFSAQGNEHRRMCGGVLHVEERALSIDGVMSQK